MSNSIHGSNGNEINLPLERDSNQVSNKSEPTSEPSSWFSKFPDLSACASTIGRFTSSCLKSLGSTISWPFYQCAAAVSRFFYGTKEDINSTNIKAIENEYGSDMASNYRNAFLELGDVEQKTAEEIKSDFIGLPPQEKTMTLLSEEVISVSKMGYYTNPKGVGLNAAPDAVIPKGGFARIYGEAERKAMLGTLNNELTDNEIIPLVESIKVGMNGRDTEIHETSDPYQLLAYGKAMSLDWDRVRLEVPDKTIARPKASAKPDENLNAFKGVIQSVTGNIVSDRAAYEMMRLIDQEGLSGGFASGSDPKTGLGFGQDRMTNMDENVVHISLGPDKSVLFNYSSAKAYLKSITTPSPDSKRIPPTTVKLNAVLSSDGNGVTLDPDITPVNRENTNVPQYELKMEYKYAYTFPATTEGKGNVNLLDSRVAYWPIRLMSAGISKSFEKQLNNPDKNVLRYAYQDESVGPESDPSMISFQFYRDLQSPSSPYLLTDKIGTTTPLYEAYNLDSTNQDEQESSPKLNKALNKFIDFIGDKDQALEVSRIVNQAWLGTLFSAMNTADGPFQLDGQSGIPSLKSPTYTISKPQEGRVVAHVAFKSEPKFFSFSDDSKPPVTLNLKKSSAEINYDITFLFDPPDSKGPPSISISPISYDYHFEKSAEDS
jgi:hypothetical protein